MRAQLFYEDTGKFSKDVLSDPKFVLWNTIIGEGSAEGPSSSTLVQVEVTGTPGSYEPLRKVEITARYKVSARAGQRSVIKRTVPVGILSRSGKFYAPLWLYDTGCDPVEVSARLIGQRSSSSSSLRKTIEFRCGE